MCTKLYKVEEQAAQPKSLKHSELSEREGEHFGSYDSS